MLQFHTIVINFTGGIVSPGYLKEVLTLAGKAGVQDVHFGLRQQLIMDIPAKRYNSFAEACREKDIVFYSMQKAVPNIVSSYPAIDIFVQESWLKGGVYKDVFDTFQYTPRLKTNICDSTQSFAPFFEGHLNWVSSSRTHFWYLYIRFPGTPVRYCWPVWVYTNDLAMLSQQIEDAILQKGELYQSDATQLFTDINATIAYTSAPIEQELSLPGFSVPYYEGFNRSGDHYWLGIYRRDELYPLSFMLDVCTVCLETRIGELYTTPWKSIIIKGVDHSQRHLWDYILGKYRINVRHAANELNWQVEDHTEEGLALKRYLIRQFDKEDVRTYGLCFAIQTRARSSMFGSVLIRKQQNKNPHRLRALDRYDILYTKDFNPNAMEYILFRENLEKSFIGTYLVSLCKLFYEQQGTVDALQQFTHAQQVPSPIHTAANKMLHQCTRCYTVYDEQYGDEDNCIPAGTLFEQLPAEYTCALCGSGKEVFTAIDEIELAKSFL